MFNKVFTFIPDSQRVEILRGLSQVINCRIVMDYCIKKEGYSISIEKNDDFNLFEAKCFPDGFLFFPYSIEMEIDDLISLNIIIKDCNKILEYLWGNGFPAVIACDFEDKLIEKGGYKSENIPWIST